MAELDPTRRDSLIRDAIDDSLTARRRAELLELLKTDAAARRAYVRQSIVDSALTELLGMESLSGALDAAHVVPENAERDRDAHHGDRGIVGRMRPLILLTTLLALIAVGIFVRFREQSSDQNRETTVQSGESSAEALRSPSSSPDTRVTPQQRQPNASRRPEPQVVGPGPSPPQVSQANPPQTDDSQENRGAASTDTQVSVVRTVFEFLTMHPSVIQRARESARRAYSVNNLKSIGDGLHRFHEAYGRFPAAYSVDGAGRPLLSWRVHLLPFLQHGDLYARFHLDEPWDSQHNRALISQMPAALRNAEADRDSGLTHYVAVRSRNSILCPPGAAERGRVVAGGVSMRDVPDGASFTIAVIEVSDRHAVIWTKPDDCELADIPQLENLGHQRNSRIFLTLFADGSVHALPKQMDAQRFLQLTTRSGGEAVSVP